MFQLNQGPFSAFSITHFSGQWNRGGIKCNPKAMNSALSFTPRLPKWPWTNCWGQTLALVSVWWLSQQPPLRPVNTQQILDQSPNDDESSNDSGASVSLASMYRFFFPSNDRPVTSWLWSEIVLSYPKQKSILGSLEGLNNFGNTTGKWLYGHLQLKRKIITKNYAKITKAIRCPNSGDTFLRCGERQWGEGSKESGMWLKGKSEEYDAPWPEPAWVLYKQKRQKHKTLGLPFPLLSIHSDFSGNAFQANQKGHLSSVAWRACSAQP